MANTSKQVQRKPKIHYVLFWMKSNRGTDTKKILSFKKRPDKGEIQDRLEYWASHQSAWNHGDNIVRYGWRWIKIPPRPELLERWKKVCATYARAAEARSIVCEMLNPTKAAEWSE